MPYGIPNDALGQPHTKQIGELWQTGSFHRFMQVWSEILLYKQVELPTDDVK